MKEIFKDIPNFENRYAISNFGRVYSYFSKQFVPQHINNSGYYRVACYKNSKCTKFYVHRLVALLFCDGYFENAVVNHKDGNKLNNLCTNLEWVTRSYNVKDGKKFVKSFDNIKPTLCYINNELHYFYSRAECARFLNIKPMRILYRQKHYNGYIPERDCFVYNVCLTTIPDECKGVKHKRLMLEMVDKFNLNLKI